LVERDEHSACAFDQGDAVFGAELSDGLHQGLGGWDGRLAREGCGVGGDRRPRAVESGMVDASEVGGRVT
jgi:hypothetical protein